MAEPGGGQVPQAGLGRAATARIVRAARSRHRGSPAASAGQPQAAGHPRRAVTPGGTARHVLRRGWRRLSGIERHAVRPVRLLRRPGLVPVSQPAELWIAVTAAPGSQHSESSASDSSASGPGTPVRQAAVVQAVRDIRRRSGPDARSAGVCHRRGWPGSAVSSDQAAQQPPQHRLAPGAGRRPACRVPSRRLRLSWAREQVHTGSGQPGDQIELADPAA